MKSTVIERRPNLTTQQIDYCLVHMLRDPDLFAYAAELLRPTDFSPASEMRYALLWGAAIDAAARSGGKLPDQGAELALAMELTSKIDNNPGDVTPEAGEKAVALLDWVFQMPADQ